MKKALLIMAAALMALCVSCKKDDDKSDGGGGGNTGGGGGGSQTVEMRISKASTNDVVYLEGSTDGGQTWNVINEVSHQSNAIYTWNDNLLSSVKTYSDDYNYNNYDFRYDNNKLSNVIWTHSSDGIIDTITYDVEYDGDNMSEVTVQYYDHGGHDRRVYHLEYSDGKLSSVTRTNGYNDVCNYFWNGDNISEVRRITGGDVEEIASYLSYDDKKNPFYGIDALLVMSVGGETNTLSKNNCTKCEYVSGSEEHLTTVTTDYTYNSENYPTQVIVNDISTAGYNPQYELTRRRGIETATIEYLD